MNILVTGANGYLGQGIVKQLLDCGLQVTACDFKTDNIDKRANIKTGNIFEIENPYEYFEKPIVVLHLAWRNGFVHYSMSHIEDLPLHFEFLKKLSEKGIDKISVMGTMHEVGFFEGAIDENTPCHPSTPYGIGKNALRDLTDMLCKQNDIIFQWLRAYYIVGNSKYGNSIFSKITLAENEGKTDFPFTMGKNQYDFIDYDEFCKQVVATVLQDNINGIINICSGRPERLSDRVERFILENDYNIKLNYGVYPDRPYDSKAVWGKNKKIMQILDSQK